MTGIEVASLHFYRAASTLGGGIGTELMVSSVMGNEFDRVTASELAAGITKYSKQFLKNDNTSDWSGIVVYFSTLDITNKVLVGMCLAGNKSRLDASVPLSGTATVTASGYITTSTDLRLEVGPGEVIFNSTDDTLADAVTIAVVAATYLTLRSPYLATWGSGKTLSVGPASQSYYVYPRSLTDSVCPPPISIPAGGAMGVWKRLIVSPGCAAFSNETFTLKFEET